ncbi:MAG: glutamyl-tRNA reductase [Myxococcota bacterium]
MMQLVAIGLSHRTAPLTLRERLLFRADELPGALAGFCALPHVAEAMIVSTCNRVEIYAAVSDVHAGTLEIRRQLGEARGIEPETLEPHLYAHEGAAAVRHVFRVASSLDSMVVGEPQIAGQLKDAYGAASAAGALGPTLHRALHRAFTVAKRVRSETSLGRGSTSVSSVAVELARHVFGDLSGRRVLLVGAGEMTALTARHLQGDGVELLVVNRSFERAVALAAEMNGRPRAWDELPDCLLAADIVITATGSPKPILEPDAIARAVRARRFRPLVLIDIAVPRDVDPRVGDIENVYLFDMDALEKALARSLTERARHARDAEKLVDGEVARFIEWAAAQTAVPTIKDLREYFMRVARAEEERLLHDLPALGAEERRKIRLALDAIVGKLLHAPLTALKDGEAQAPPDLAGAARRLFALEAASARPTGRAREAAAPERDDAEKS